MDQRLVNDLAFEFFFTLSSLTDKEELQLPDSVVPVLKEAVDQKNESLQKTTGVNLIKNIYVQFQLKIEILIIECLFIRIAENLIVYNDNLLGTV
jgi:hypothetical protein